MLHMPSARATLSYNILVSPAKFTYQLSVFN